MIIHRPTLRETHALTAGACHRRMGGAGMRRGLRGPRGGGGGGAPEFPSSGLLHRWRADVYTEDVGVTIWDDLVGTVDPAMVTDTQEPTPRASNADLNGAPTIDFDGTDDNLVAAASKSVASIKRLHDGTGVTLYWCGYLAAFASPASRPIISTVAQAAGTYVGFSIGKTQSGSNLHFSLMNGSGTFLYTNTALGGAAVSFGAAHSIVIQHGTGRNGNQIQVFFDFASILTASYTGTASSADSTEQLIFGRWPDLVRFSNDDWAEVAIWDDPDMDLAALQAYSEDRYGV